VLTAKCAGQNLSLSLCSATAGAILPTLSSQKVDHGEAHMRELQSVAATICLIALMTLGASATKIRVWQQGRVVSFGYDEWESRNTSPVNCSTIGSVTSCTGGQTMRWNHVTYKVALHTGKQTLFAERTLSFRWQHSPKLTENSLVKFAIEKNNLYLVDESGREFHMYVGKARKNTLSERLQECQATVEEVREANPDIAKLHAWLGSLTGLELWQTYMYDLECSSTAMRAVDIPTVDVFQAILAEMLLAQSENNITPASAEASPSMEQCANTASSVEAGDPKSLAPETIAGAARILYTCAMDAYRRNERTWFIPSAKARGLLLDELVTRARNAAFATPTKK